MDKYQDKEVEVTFLHEVGFPDGTLRHLVQGRVEAYDSAESWVKIQGITINFKDNPITSICLSAAEQYNDSTTLPCRFVRMEGGKSALFTANFEGAEYAIEIDADGDIGGSYTKDGITRYGDLKYHDPLTRTT